MRPLGFLGILRLRRSLLRILAAVLAVAALNAAPPKPKLVREINLNAIIHESDGFAPSTHSVQALAFSPDEKWIAAGVGVHYKPGTLQPMEFASHLVVIPLRDGAGPNLQIDPEVRITQDALIWAPDSTTIVISSAPVPKWYSIPGGQLWKQGKPDPKLGGIRGFIDEHLGATYALQVGGSPAEPYGAPRVVYIFDLFWSHRRRMAPSGPLVNRLQNPDRHLLAVSEIPGSPKRPSPIFCDYPGKKIVQELVARSSTVRVADLRRGRKQDPLRIRNLRTRHTPYPTCWDIDSGKEDCRVQGFSRRRPSFRQHSSIAHYPHSAFEMYFACTRSEFDMHSYKGGDRIVWDSRTDKQIAEWVPISQVRLKQG